MLVLALSGAVAGADPPPWAHGHGHGGQGAVQGDQGNAGSTTGSAGQASTPSTSAGGQGGGGQGNADQGGGQGNQDNPGHGGTPPGHDPSHGHAHGNGNGANAAAASTPTPAPAPTPTQAPIQVPVITTPALTTPTPTPIAPSPPTVPVTAGPSPGPGPGLTIAPRPRPSARRGGGRFGSATTARRGGGLFLGNPLTLALAPATGRLGPSATATGRAAVGAHHSGQAVKVIVVPPSSTPATVIARFISRIPTAVWIALAAAIGLAATAGGAAVALGRRARHRAAEVATVTAAASTDQLTGVLNRRGFTESAQRELERARRYGHPLALAYVDVRGLKAVNDSEGHLAGDQLLREVAALLSESARTHDLVGRMGGDELAVLLAEQAAPGAAAMTRRVRSQIPVHRAALGLNTDWDVTIGTASFPDDGQTLEDLVAAADRRLYEQRGIALRDGRRD